MTRPKPTGKIAGKLPHRDAKPENIMVRTPRMRRPHQRGQGPA